MSGSIGNQELTEQGTEGVATGDPEDAIGADYGGWAGDETPPQQTAHLSWPTKRGSTSRLSKR